MTVALGFTCHDGLVLAVDSEISNDVSRFEGDKAWVFRHPYREPDPTLQVGIVGSGDLAFIRYAAERINHELEADMTKDDVQGVVQGVINDIHLNHLYPYPETSTRPSIELIIGVFATDGRRLMATSLTAVSKVWNYEAVGIGQPLANFLIRRFYAGRVTVATAAFLSAQVLMHARNNVPRCGGDSKILVMNHEGGVVGFVRNDTIKEYEGYTDKFEAVVRPVMFSGPDKAVSTQEFEQRVDALAEELKRVRPIQLQQVDSIARNIVLIADAASATWKAIAGTITMKKPDEPG